MMEPIYDRLLDLAAQNIACARSALARGQHHTATTNARSAIDLLHHFNRRLPAPNTSEPNTSAPAAAMASDHSSITKTTTPTPEKAEAKKAPTTRDGTGAGV